MDGRAVYLYLTLQTHIYVRTYVPLDVGIVTVATFGSPNTTPCDIAAAGIDNLTVNCKSMSPTFSGPKLIGTRAFLLLILAKKFASLVLGSKNV